MMAGGGWARARPIGFADFLVLFLLVVAALLYLLRKKRHPILLIGPSGSGKTALLIRLARSHPQPTTSPVTPNWPTTLPVTPNCSTVHQQAGSKAGSQQASSLYCSTAHQQVGSLAHQQAGSHFPATALSQTPNQATYRTGKKTTTIIDTPGNPKLLHESAHLLSNCKCAILLLDATDKNSMREAAGILADQYENFKKNRTKLLIVANKTDLIGSRSLQSVRDVMELELERRGGCCLGYFRGVQMVRASWGDLGGVLGFIEAS